MRSAFTDMQKPRAFLRVHHPIHAYMSRPGDVFIDIYAIPIGIRPPGLIELIVVI